MHISAVQGDCANYQLDYIIIVLAAHTNIVVNSSGCSAHVGITIVAVNLSYSSLIGYKARLRSANVGCEIFVHSGKFQCGCLTNRGLARCF